jgi:hypothetical protein
MWLVSAAVLTVGEATIPVLSGTVLAASAFASRGAKAGALSRCSGPLRTVGRVPDRWAPPALGCSSTVTASRGDGCGQQSGGESGQGVCGIGPAPHEADSGQGQIGQQGGGGARLGWRTG